MALDISQIVTQMLNAALPILTSGGTKVEDFATTEFKKIAERFVEIGEEVASGRVHADDAPMLLDDVKDTAAGVFLAVEGMSKITVEQAINAAMDVVKGVVNSTLGFGLII